MSGKGATLVEGASLRVRVLGGFTVEGFEERALGTRKARLLLKRLALASGGPVSADELAAVVWGEELPQRPADQVSVLASRLRSVLGPDRLPRSDAGYSLAADWFDLVELERAVAQIEDRLQAGEAAAALAAAHAALGLAAGELLPEEDGEWVDDARPGAERLLARARLLAAEAALAAGEVGPARAAAQAVLDGDPYDEAALRLVMRADALAGRPAAALAAYAATRHRLAEDLGTDPAPETERLHTAIVRSELPSLAITAQTAPNFVGRAREWDLLDAALARAAQGEAVAVVVEAEAGMGKSALLSAWTSRVATALVISGRCDELGGGLPLQPLTDGLAAHLELVGREAAAELLGGEATMLEHVLGRTTPDRRVGVTTVGDAQASRTALFGALATVLRRAAGDRPLVLEVDDLHQAAAGTAEFLAFALRRISRLMVLAARRPEAGPALPTARRVSLGPLAVNDVVELVGAERGPVLYERSGGHPLFLRELASAGDEQLPASVVAAVRAQLERLGDAAVTLEAAASCGTDIDATLIAAITGRPVPSVLDDIEHAAKSRLLRPRSATMAFSHELVRQAIEAGTLAPRRQEIHRAATAELARRSDTDPLALARHARLGGDPIIAAEALVAAAARAAERFEIGTALELLEQAVELADSPAARMARGRLRLGRLDLDGARTDAESAIDLGAGVEGFELAGWVAYYGRDYDTALRYAEEGTERASDPAVRASCLSLAGRIRHTRGDLAEAAERFEEGVTLAPAGIRGMVQIWHAQLLTHCGEPERAVDIACRGLLDPHIAHPFAPGHGRFTLAYALGVTGRWSPALDAVDELDTLAARTGDKRFPPVAANMRGWLLRGAGLLDEAIETHQAAVGAAPGPTFQEAHYAALLDLTECHLAGGDIQAASATMDAASSVLDWTGSMSWRHRNRYGLLAARLASLSGRSGEAAEGAHAAASAATERGDRRHQHRAELVAATIEARAGRSPRPEALAQLVEDLLPLAGPDGWRDLGELAKAAGSDDIWRLAEKHAAAIVAEAAGRPGVDADRVDREVCHQLERLKP